MRRACSRWPLIVAGMLLSSVWAEADEPQRAEPLPPPRAVDPPVIILPEPPVFFPVGRDIWQLYAVDRTGRFRPRVAYTPSASFYVYNYLPYPWTTTRQLEWMPYATD
jgi:hypothetical protein